MQRVEGSPPLAQTGWFLVQQGIPGKAARILEEDGILRPVFPVPIAEGPGPVRNFVFRA